jgi:hypothetical protein
MDATPVYICPMHTAVRETRPGRCPTCGMNLVSEGARFMLLRHMLGSPVHIAIMAGIMVVIMAAAMMMMR